MSFSKPSSRSISRQALDAPIKVTREISTARQCMAPIEGRGVVATWDHRLDQLTLYTGAQMPHIVRTGLSDCLGLEQGRIRVISPDVGGGFGYKGILLPEEVCLAWLAMRCGHPVRWIEDRREHLTRQRQLPRAPLRHHRLCRSRRPPARHRLRGDGRFRRLFVLSLLGLPRSGAGREHSARPLRFPAYRCRTYSVATNKCPILPYRGVARTGVCFALELMLDAIAARGRPRAARGAAAQPRAPGANAVRQHHQEAFRQRRLSGSLAARGRRRSTSTPCARASAQASPTAA